MSVGQYPLQGLKVLYIGSMEIHSNSFGRYRTLKELGLELQSVDIDKTIYQSIFSPIHHRMNFGPGIYRLNKAVRNAIRDFDPQLIWVDNKPFITAATIQFSRHRSESVKWINLVTDDPTHRYRRAWRLFKSTASLYDNHFVQRPENIAEVQAYGARNVDLCFRSFDPSFHRPVKLDVMEYEKYKSPVGFIGTYEEQRERSIAYLIKNGIHVQVTGDGWPNGSQWSFIKPYYTGPSVYGEEYIKRLNGMDIALHFLRHANRDGQDSRTFEIPACGVFMLAERSELHRQFFLEDKESAFFGSDEELLQKVLFFSKNHESRKKIAENGYLRCISSGYNHKSRLESVLQLVLA